MTHILEPTPDVIEGIIGKVKTNGMFDEMRRNCLADIDTKPAFQNLKQRVENFVNALLSAETWTPSLNKNHLRAKVRSSVMKSGMLNTGIEHILHQVVDAKMYTEFLPKITDFLSENNDALYTEFGPKPEVEIKPPGDEECVDDNHPPPPEHGNLQNLPDEATLEEAAPPQEEREEPMIPEGAANTLRTLIQSLMTTDFQSLLTTEDSKETKEVNSRRKNSGTSPSIDPSQIEAFTDEDKEPGTEDEHDKGGPCTPGDKANSTAGRKASSRSSPVKHRKNAKVNSESHYHPCSSSNEEEIAQEDLRKVDSDASFGSNVEVTPASGSDVVVNDCEIEEDKDEDVEDTEDIEEQTYSYEEEHVDIVDVNETFDTLEEVDLIQQPEDGNVVQEECVVVDERSQLMEITAEAEVAGEDFEIQHHGHSREKKRRHKKHRRRRHSTSDGDSDESGHVSSPSERDSSDEVKSEEAEVTRSRSRKKKKKKRSKKHKRSKSRVRDQSQERSLWIPSPEYRRSISPHAERSQRQPFNSSPQLHLPPRFDDENRNVTVEPAFMPKLPPRFRDPYAPDMKDNRPPPMGNPEHPFHMGPHDGMMGFPPRPGFPSRSPPPFPPHMRPRFSPPRFSPGHSRFSPPHYSRGPPYRPGSPPPRRYSPTFDYFRPIRPGFDPPAAPPLSPPPNRRFSPPRQMPRFPAGMLPRPFPGPPEERFMMRPTGPMPHVPPGPMMRPDMPHGPRMDMHRPPMR